MAESSIVQGRVLRREYRDSMVLMYLSGRLEKMPGVLKAVAIMGTEANKGLLASMNLEAPQARDAGPSDLLVAVRAADPGAAAGALARLEELLSRQVTPGESEEVRYHSLEGAAEALPGANLALISVPGAYASREARKALERGLHVFLFSDHVPLREEADLKRLARDRGLLLMGPDCGTAVINGTVLGFGNRLRRGAVGMVGASGTGIQEVSVLLDRAGLGVSHAIGTGGRDLDDQVGAVTTLSALDLLEEDPGTQVLVVLSKPASPEVSARVRARLKSSSKPAVACFLGSGRREAEGNLHLVPTLAEAARTAAGLLGRAPEAGDPWQSGALAPDGREGERLARGQRFVRGLFSGGSLCQEAQVVWRDLLGPVWSNAPLEPGRRLADPPRSHGHTALDLGGDFFTRARPHPMIDPAARCQRILQEAEDPGVAVIVLDVLLGIGAHPDMAGALLAAVGQARRKASAAGRHLAVVARVVGTRADPQGLDDQEGRLRSEGVVVAPSNAAAAKIAAAIARRDPRGGPIET